MWAFSSSKLPFNLGLLIPGKWQTVLWKSEGISQVALKIYICVEQRRKRPSVKVKISLKKRMLSPRLAQMSRPLWTELQKQEIAWSMCRTLNSQLEKLENMVVALLSEIWIITIEFRVLHYLPHLSFSPDEKQVYHQRVTCDFWGKHFDEGLPDQTPPQKNFIIDEIPSRVV